MKLTSPILNSSIIFLFSNASMITLMALNFLSQHWNKEQDILPTTTGLHSWPEGFSCSSPRMYDIVWHPPLVQSMQSTVRIFLEIRFCLTYHRFAYIEFLCYDFPFTPYVLCDFCYVGIWKYPYMIKPNNEAT